MLLPRFPRERVVFRLVRAALLVCAMLTPSCVSTHGHDRELDKAPADPPVTTLAPSQTPEIGAPPHDAEPRDASSPADAGSLVVSEVSDAADPCRCSPLVCPSGTQLVALPGVCCPLCQPCAQVSCPAIACGHGLEPLVPTGQCCATACKYADVDPKAFGAITLPAAATCEHAKVPVCNGNGWPGCSANWEEALGTYANGCPGARSSYLARCDHYNAIVNTNEFDRRVFFFDRKSGRLVGHQAAVGREVVSCLAYDASFTLGAEVCEPWVTSCIPEDDLPSQDAGVALPWTSPPLCAEGQVAFDDYVRAQLAQYNSCTQDLACHADNLLDILSPCEHACGLMLSDVAINGDLLNRLDAFGRMACARCPTRPACPPTAFFETGRCVNGHCAPNAP